jgi:recombination associated protein RdgC
VFFKNLQVYRLSKGWAMAPGALEAELARQPLLPCSGINLMSRGWVAPHQVNLVEAYQKHLLIALGVEQKMLPASVVKQEAEARAQALEQKQGYKPGKKQLRELKERVTAELLPRAFARRRVTRCWINPVDGFVVVDAATPARAEEVLEKLRETLGELPATLLQTETSAQGLNTRWLASGSPDAGFELHEDCELRAPDESGGAIRYVRHGLEGKDIRDHIATGKVVSKLGLVFKSRLGLLLQEPLSVKRLKFLEVEKNEVQDEMGGNKDERFEADFALMVGEVTALLTALLQSLGGEKA